VPPARVSEPGCIDIGADVVVREGAWLSGVRAHDHIRPRLALGDRVRLGRVPRPENSIGRWRAIDSWADLERPPTV
jgi:hypothetical protein